MSSIWGEGTVGGGQGCLETEPFWSQNLFPHRPPNGLQMVKFLLSEEAAYDNADFVGSDFAKACNKGCKTQDMQDYFGSFSEPFGFIQ